MSQHGSASRSPEGSSPVNGTTVGFDLDQPTKRILCSHMTLPSNADPERAGSSVKQMVNRRNSRDKENSPPTLWGGGSPPSRGPLPEPLQGVAGVSCHFQTLLQFRGHCPEGSDHHSHLHLPGLLRFFPEFLVFLHFLLFLPRETVPFDVS